MDLIIKNKIIKTPILTILKQLKSELNNGKLETIKYKHDNIIVPCPVHKNGLEKHPSCNLYCGDDPKIEKGTCNCFTCGFHGSLQHFIGACFDCNDTIGEEWLVERFGNILIEDNSYLAPIEKKIENKYLNENILNNFQDYHPYMEQRKLNLDIIKKFKIKYDSLSKSIVFPVWDEHNNLIMLTKRSIETKNFYIDKNIEKPVYLLNEIININSTIIYIAESQINALTLWGWGFPAVATFGCNITAKQFDLINKYNPKRIILCLDPDEAGIKGTYNILKNINKNILIDIVILPRGKDINDLTQEEFLKCPKYDKLDWLKMHNFKIFNV